jgi:hypothetical protein
MMEERVKDMVHETLKSGRCITMVERHDEELIIPLGPRDL